MKKFVISVSAVLLVFCAGAQQQQDKNGLITHPEELEVTFLGSTQAWRDIPIPKVPVPSGKTLKYGYHFKADWILNPNVNPNVYKGLDPVLQKEYNTSTNKTITETANWAGMNTNTSPGDPCMDVGPNHVVQMINATRVKIWDKSGAVVLAEQAFSTLAGTPAGGGDPIVLYDERADRWLLSEFASGGNTLYIAISQTPDPTGAYYTYSVATSSFPDYPKYSIWDNSYLVTANEGGGTTSVYALDRSAMLAGTAHNAQSFTIPRFGTIGFQASTPVSLMGTTVSGAPATLIRMRDDAWGGSSSDAVEVWELDINWASPGAATLAEIIAIPVSAHESELCGYTSFTCIPQPSGSNALDPLRELIMNRAMYRNFGTHESMVAAHVTDVDGSDHAGIRWYEFRRSGGSWSLYQEGTYSPDAEHRWMPCIGLSATGNIGMAYNVSSSSTHPEIRYTGRKECDPLGMMTEPETILVDGTASNNTNRWGDYNAMGVDPSDGETFWFNAQYNPNSQARTRIGAFSIDQCSPTVQFNSSAYNPNEGDADVAAGCLDYYVVDVPIKIGSDPSQPADIVVNVTGGTATQGVDYDIFNTVGTLDDPTLSFTVQIRVYNDNYVEGTETITLDYSLNPNGGNAVAGTSNQTVTVTINDDDLAPGSMTSSVVLLTEDFEGLANPALPGTWSTVNNGTPADTPWQSGDAAAATSAAVTVPTSNTSDFAWINDDDCNCDQNDVDLIFPSIDLSGFTGATVDFLSYFEGKSWSGDTESCDLVVSVGGGPFTNVGSITANAGWYNSSFDATPYAGNANVVFAIKYSDGTGYLYAAAIDDVVVTGIGPIDVQQAVNAGSAMTANLGPNSTVHFYDATTQDVMMTLDNTSGFDFGCVTVQVDRAGTGAAQFSSTNTSNYLADKTFTVTPTNNSASATYDVTLYYKEAEVAGWESATGNARSVAEVIKVAGANPISVVTPANYGTYTIDNVVGSIGAFNADVTFTATFGNGFSGFGLGVYAPGIPGAPTAGFSPSTSTECEGGCITFTDASVSTDPGGITGWAWDFGDGNSSTSPSPTNCYATAGTYVVTLVVTDAVASDNQTSVVTIGAATTHSIAANLCPGQSVTAGSSTYTTAGTYTDVLTNAAGCDSTITTTVVELAATTFSQSTTFCDGGNIVVGSSTYTTSGTYTDVLTNAAGCDSTVTTTVTVNPNPTPTIDNASALDTLCENGNPVTILSTPVGGTFSGTGVSGNSFNPLTAGPGSHTVTYSYTDGSGCVGQAQITVIVVDCTIGIKEEALEGVSLFPSPNNGQFVINGLVAGTTYKIFDEQGKLVLSETVGSSSEDVSLKNVADGIYVLRTTKNGKEGSIKFTVTKQ